MRAALFNLSNVFSMSLSLHCASFLKLLMWLCITLFHPVALAQALPEPVLEALRRAAVPLDATSVVVREVGATQSWVSLNAGRPMNPASTMKLLTTWSALELLGPSYTWNTQVLSTAAPREVLQGDLVIKGSGDPKLVIENFWILLRELRMRGVREIAGDVILDRSRFAPAVHDPAAFDDAPLRAYNVGPDALLLNHKIVTFRFIPDEATRSVQVIADPRLPEMLTPALRYSDGPCRNWRELVQPDFTVQAAPRFVGTYAGACGTQTWSVALLDPVAYANLLFRQVWSDLGGTLRGRVRDGVTPPAAQVLSERQSPPLVEIVRDINKFSNNVMTRQVLLTLGAALSGTPASERHGALVIRQWLDQRGLGMPELVIENGSGLSRIERISAQSMANMLNAAWQSPTMPELISSLSLVGYDGTMRRRLGIQSVAGRAHVKTGLLNDVRAIAGYVLAASGRRYVVVSMIQHANALASREAHDALLQWVHAQG